MKLLNDRGGIAGQGLVGLLQSDLREGCCLHPYNKNKYKQSLLDI